MIVSMSCRFSLPEGGTFNFQYWRLNFHQTFGGAAYQVHVSEVGGEPQLRDLGKWKGRRWHLDLGRFRHNSTNDCIAVLGAGFLAAGGAGTESVVLGPVPFLGCSLLQGHDSFCWGGQAARGWSLSIL